MIYDFKKIVPSKTLPTFNGTKRVWIKPRKFFINKMSNCYEIFYKNVAGRSKTRFKITRARMPLTIKIDKQFLCSIAMYVCEGNNPLTGVYTKYKICCK